METKVITPGATVPYKCCLPSSKLSVKNDFDTDVLFKLTLSHIFSYLLDGVYVTYVADVDNDM